MERNQRVLVCIDGSNRDPRMLGFAGTISQLWNTKRLHLLYVAREPGDTPYPTPPVGRDPEVTPDSMRALADRHFRGHGGERIISGVRTGFPLMEILRYAHDQDIDLIIIGRRSALDGHTRGEEEG